MDKLLNIETHASASFDINYDSNNNNKQAQDDLDVNAPKDLFPPNDQDDMTQQLDQDIDDTSLEEEEANEEVDDLLDDNDDSTQTNLDPDATDLDTTVDGTDDGASVALDENDNSGLGSDTYKVNILGEDMEDSIFDSPARINLETDETQEGSVTVDDELQEQEQEQQEQQEEEEEDETVDKTWDMAGDDVDDDQENSSVDALLDAGEESLDGNNNSSIEDVINDDTFVVDELAENKMDESTTGDESSGGQHTWNNDNIELTGSGDASVLEDNSPQTWNNDDDTEAEVEDEQDEETMEQGTVEESENDRLGATLEHALDALELEQDAITTTELPPSPITVDSGNNIIVDDVSRADDLQGFKDNGDTALPLDDSVGKSAPLPPPQQHETTSSIESDSMDELASVDTSLVLLIAVFILLCLRLPYVKRFFVKLFKSQESTTLPYHTAHSKELD
ncbi:hypothetical protein BCR42DRAFT_454238 [Absidia repens]|uniref:Uncharacterized protein n=1 Tax=Absidia repens TaxID=90262 RepID=A0A1X2I7U3_9FUNG|nr:hypothetical protein BCR42DRAFT_454238 [Absidia repens]